jgi:XTP/dITP diphosphohydrolase
LGLLIDQSNRKALFRTVVVLVVPGAEHIFEGRLEGEITLAEAGGGGMAYSPIFRPNGSSKTLAEMSLEERAMISHRAIAIKHMAQFLESAT